MFTLVNCITYFLIRRKSLHFFRSLIRRRELRSCASRLWWLWNAHDSVWGIKYWRDEQSGVSYCRWGTQPSCSETMSARTPSTTRSVGRWRKILGSQCPPLHSLLLTRSNLHRIISAGSKGPSPSYNRNINFKKLLKKHQIPLLRRAIR